MRIISGIHKGKKIIAPAHLPVRPTTDMLKEALFNILTNYYNFGNIRVLDLFSGTGNIAYEFASRGSSDITIVEQNKDCIQFIKKMDRDLKLNLHIVNADVFNFLQKANIKYDLIFADPPYILDSHQFAKIVDSIFTINLLTDEGMLVVEHSKHTSLSLHEKFKFQKSYGGSTFSFFEKY